MNKSIKKNYIFNLIYQITLLIVPLIVTPYVSRILLADGIGKYSFTSSLITYFTIFACFGFENYAQREIANHQNDKEKQSAVFWEILIARMAPVFVSVAVNLILIFCNAYAGYTKLMLILTTNIVAIAFDVAFYLQGNEEFGKLLTRNLIIKLIGTILIFILIKQHSDLYLYVSIHVGMTVVSNISLWPMLLKRLKKVSFKSLKPLKHIWPAFKLFIPAIAISMYTILDKTLIGLITHSDVQNGYYEQADKIIKISMTVITCLSAVMIPRNSNEIAQGNYENVKQNIYKSFNFVWLLGIPMMFGMILVADKLVPWFLGEDFNYSAVLIKTLAPIIIIIGSSNIIGLHYMIPNKQEKKYTLSIIVGSISNLILNIILITFFKSLGAAIATIAAEILVTTVMLIMIRKEFSFKEIFKTCTKPLIAALTMTLVCLPLYFNLTPGVINSIIIISVGALAYAAMLLILKEKMTYHLLKKLLSKIKKSQK